MACCQCGVTMCSGQLITRARVALAVFASVVLLSFVTDVGGVHMETTEVKMVDGDAHLTCTVRGIGKKRVMWRKLSEPFPLVVGTTRFLSTKKYRVKRNGDDWKLVIKKVLHSDAGEYQCSVTGKDSSSPAEVLSLLIPGADHTHLLPTDVMVLTPLGSTAVLPCHVQNLRKHLVLWQRKDGQLVSLRKKTYSGDRRHKVLRTSRAMWSLEVRNVKSEDLGVYTCVVNTTPLLTRTVTLREGKPQAPGDGDKVPEIGQSAGGSPQLESESFRDEVGVKQYQDVTLLCRFSGEPTPTVHWERRVWTRDGTKIVEDLKTEGDHYTLTNAQLEDTGVYVCKANNGVPPPQQAKIRVSVQEVVTTTTPVPTTTRFDPVDEAAARVYAMEQEVYSDLSCKAVDVPQPTVHLLSNARTSLFHHHAVGCTAPRVYAIEDEVYQGYGRDAEMSCMAVGVPRPTVHWLLDGVQLQRNYKYDIIEFDVRHHTLMSKLLVRSVHSGNFKRYSCYAFNQYGDETVTIVLGHNPDP